MKTLFLCVAMLVATLSYAQNPVAWKFSAEKTSNNEYILTAKATINDGWYVYSQYLENDNGPIATAITIESEHTATEKATESGKKISGFDALFDMTITKYKQEVIIQQKITTTDSILKGYLTFMTCNDDSCLPPRDVDFSLELQ